VRGTSSKSISAVDFAKGLIIYHYGKLSGSFKTGALNVIEKLYTENKLDVNAKRVANVAITYKKYCLLHKKRYSQSVFLTMLFMETNGFKICDSDMELLAMYYKIAQSKAMDATPEILAFKEALTMGKSKKEIQLINKILKK